MAGPADERPSGRGRPALSRRLTALLEAVRPGLPLWDVGCDHGRLGLRALADGRVPKVTLVDRSPAACSALEQTLARHAPRADVAARVRCLDAARQDLELGAGTLVIAGLGGFAMLRILERQLGAGFVQAPAELRLVLQPELDDDSVARALSSARWRVDASAVRERGRRHALLCASPQSMGASG